MSMAGKMQKLGAISALSLDQRLTVLRQMHAARQTIVDRIAALDLPPVVLDLPLAAAQKADMNYQTWADQRRMQLNLLLAAASAKVLQAEAEARAAFAKDSVLVALQTRLSAVEKRSIRR